MKETAFTLMEALASRTSDKIGVADYIHNVRVRILPFEEITLTLEDESFEQSFVASLYSQFVLYPEQEISRLQNAWVKRLWKSAELLLKAIPWKQSAQVNNLFFTTNPISPGLEEKLDYLESLAHDLEAKFLSLRSLNYREHSSLLHELERRNWILLPTRRVFIFDGEKAAFLKKEALKKDFKHLQKLNFTRVGHDDIRRTEAARILSLYQSLYIQKHSQLNPQYSLRFIENVIDHRWLELQGLRDAEGNLRAVVGYLKMDQSFTVPFLGYDTERDADLDIYRALVALVMQKTASEKRLLNYSSGAGEFKRRRGGEAEWEFTALFLQNLPKIQQLKFRAFKWAMEKAAKPLFEHQNI